MLMLMKMLALMQSLLLSPVLIRRFFTRICGVAPPRVTVDQQPWKLKLQVSYKS